MRQSGRWGKTTMSSRIFTVQTYNDAASPILGPRVSTKFLDAMLIFV